MKTESTHNVCTCYLRRRAYQHSLASRAYSCKRCGLLLCVRMFLAIVFAKDFECCSDLDGVNKTTTETVVRSNWMTSGLASAIMAHSYKYLCARASLDVDADPTRNNASNVIAIIRNNIISRI